MFIILFYFCFNKTTTSNKKTSIKNNHILHNEQYYTLVMYLYLAYKELDIKFEKKTKIMR